MHKCSLSVTKEGEENAYCLSLIYRAQIDTFQILENILGRASMDMFQNLLLRSNNVH